MTGVDHRTVSEADADIRLDRWFQRHLPGLSFGRLQKLLRTGQVRVDGKRAKAGQRVRAGQEIRVPPLGDAMRPPAAAPGGGDVEPADRAFLERLVLYRDDDVLVLDKPAGLPVQGGSKVARSLDGLLAALADPDHGKPRLVHRLDRDTSGVLVLGRTAAAAASLAAAFRGRDAKKLYWAVTVGAPAPRKGTVDLALAKRAGRAGEKMEAVAAGDAPEGDADARDASTRYAVVNQAAETAGGLAWVAFLPLTGRTHQIRVHAAALGTPILGDGKYGGRRAFPDLSDVPGRPALHLHARRLIVDHPAGGVLDVAAPLPEHMAETFRRSGFDPAAGGDPFGLGHDQKISGRSR